VKVCFDTSTLVAALLQQHPHHALAFPRLQDAKEGKIQGHLTTHGLAELFAALTALPLKPRLLPADAERLIKQSILACFTMIPLEEHHYREAIQLAVGLNLSSGAIYDALHLIGARSVNCEALFTLNLRHFRSLAQDDSIVRSP